MILTVNGADFSKAYIGETKGYSVLVSGRGSSNTNWVDKGNDLTMSITINANYTYESLEITVGNNPLNKGFTATHSNGTVSLVIPANLITGVVRIKVNATSTNTGGGTKPPVTPGPEPEGPGNSVTLKFMEQNLVDGFYAQSGVLQSSNSHQYFSIPADNVKSITITPDGIGVIAKLYYVVQTTSNNQTIRMFDIMDDFSEGNMTKTIELENNTGTLYFNVFDGKKTTNTYGYAREAIVTYK